MINVGTDPSRYLGMKGLTELNNLQLSKNFGTVIVPQKGYVPPPLLGIFARYPYFHNNSVASLCELLKPASQRAKYYLARAANDESTDFDKNCVGYSITSSEELKHKKSAPYVFDTTLEGAHATGHDEGIFLDAGRPLWSENQRHDLIEFLKTL